MKDGVLSRWQRLKVLPDRRWVLAAVLLSLMFFGVLWRTAPAVGYVRDEGYYFKAAEEYGRWWDVLFSKRFLSAFEDAEIKRHFDFNTEHPALVKLSLGLSYRLLVSTLGVTTPAQGYRATGFFFGALSLLVTFLLGRSLVSSRVGLLAAAFLATHPRYFYDAHLACFDVPMTAMWTGCLWAFWRARRSPPDAVKKRALFAGLVFGLALATKLNGVFLPFIFVAIWLYESPVFAQIRSVPAPSGGRDFTLPKIPWVLLACAVLAPVVFYLHWPHLWHDPFTRVGKYLNFHLNHEHYPVLFFGELLAKPPFPHSVPWVMTLYTVPAPMLLLGAFGLLVSVSRGFFRRSSADLLLLLSVLIPIGLLSTGSTPIFGGVKHWYNAMPALAIIAARSAFWGLESVALPLERLPQVARRSLLVVFGLLLLGPGVLGIRASHPNGIGFYNEIAGGFTGGAALGMQRGFWGGLAQPLYENFDRRFVDRGGVFFNRTNYDAFRMYRRENLIGPGIHYANDAKQVVAGVAFEQPEHGEREAEIWSSLGPRPVDGVYADNVTLVQIYVRDRSRSPPPVKSP